MAKKQDEIKCEVFDFGGTAYLKGSKTAITFSDHKEMVGDSTTPKSNIEPKNGKTYGEKAIDFAKKGLNDKQPVEIMDKIFALSTLGSNVAFNSKMAYGDGIMVVKKIRDDKTKEIKIVEQLPSEQPEIFKFLEENNYIGSAQEWGNDIVVFNEGYVEFVFARGENKLVEIHYIESVNSRISIADDNGDIKYHGRSLKWHESNPEDVQITPLLDRRRALKDLRVRRGLDFDLNGKKATPKKTESSYVLQLMLPTPGRFYYGKPYWWSIFTDWYEFALAIPKFKKALLQNQMVIKFHVKIAKKFWPKLFLSRGLNIDVNKAECKACREKFLLDMDKFLSGEENAGKSFVSEFEYDKINKYEDNDIIITPIDSGVKGGEYLDDSSEVTNIICYAMEIHPSVVGATGKSGTINGTEARELFIIKQALQKPIRDLFVQPLYIAKNINGWDPDIHFIIPNIMLTTLDQNTGAIKSTGNQKLP